MIPTFLSLKNDLNVPSKSNKQKNIFIKICFLLAFWRVNYKNSRIRIRIQTCHGSGTLVDGHPIVSFDTDTGLKQALATVNDYNPLMKDFPINDLLSATELDRIRTSVQVPIDLRNRTRTFSLYTLTEFWDSECRILHPKTCAKSSLISLILNKF